MIILDSYDKNVNVSIIAGAIAVTISLHPPCVIPTQAGIQNKLPSLQVTCWMPDQAGHDIVGADLCVGPHCPWVGR